MRPGLGLFLRLLGPLIEVGCILTLLRVRGQDLHVLGLPAETLAKAGIALGVVIVLAGIMLSRRQSRRRDQWDSPRESS